MKVFHGMALVAATALSIAPLAVSAQQSQVGLVNIAVEDVLNNNTVIVQVPIAVAVEVCDVTIAVAARAIRRGQTACTITQDQATEAGIG